MFLDVRKLGEVGRVGHKPSNGSPFGLASKSLEIDEQRQEPVVIDSGEEMWRTRNLCIVRINLVPVLIQSVHFKEDFRLMCQNQAGLSEGNGMPVISMFYGIVIRMYFLEDARHGTQHIHARYAPHEASIRIDDGEVLAGK